MKLINIICSDGISGHEKPILEMHNFLIKKKINSRFFFLTNNLQIKKIFKIKKISLENIDIIQYKSNFDLIYLIYKLLSQYNKFIIHSHLTKADLICSILKKLKFNKLILISTRPYDYNFSTFYSFIYKYLYRFFSNFNYQISISENISNLIINEGYDLKKISCIYYGSRSPNILIKNNFIKKKSKIQISIVGRFLKWKNHSKVLDHFQDHSFKKFIIENNINFVFYGNGLMREYLIKKIKQKKLKKFVSIKINILNQDKIYNSTDILLHPSIFEGFGLVAIEAISYKKPVICNKSIGMSNMIKKISKKLVIDINSPKQLIDSIKFTINNYNKVSDNSYLFFKNNLTYDKMANSYLKIYKKINGS